MTEFFESGINLSTETIFSKCIIVKYGRHDNSIQHKFICVRFMATMLLIRINGNN